MSKVDLITGRQLKTGGRLKGTPNRVTTDLRLALADFVLGNIENVQAWLHRVAAENPAKAIELYLDLLQFTVPKLRAIGIDVREPAGSRPVKAMSLAELQAIVAEDEAQPRRLSAPYADLI